MIGRSWLTVGAIEAKREQVSQTDRRSGSRLFNFRFDQEYVQDAITSLAANAKILELKEMAEVLATDQVRLLKIRLEFARNIVFGVGGSVGIVFFISQGTAYLPYWTTFVLEGLAGFGGVYYVVHSNILWILDTKGRLPLREWSIWGGWYVAYIIAFALRLLMEVHHK